VSERWDGLDVAGTRHVVRIADGLPGTSTVMSTSMHNLPLKTASGEMVEVKVMEVPDCGIDYLGIDFFEKQEAFGLKSTVLADWAEQGEQEVHIILGSDYSEFYPRPVAFRGGAILLQSVLTGRLIVFGSWDPDGWTMAPLKASGWQEAVDSGLRFDTPPEGLAWWQESSGGQSALLVAWRVMRTRSVRQRGPGGMQSCMKTVAL
jgi:hypothetical protein